MLFRVGAHLGIDPEMCARKRQMPTAIKSDFAKGTGLRLVPFASKGSLAGSFCRSYGVLTVLGDGCGYLRRLGFQETAVKFVNLTERME